MPSSGIAALRLTARASLDAALAEQRARLEAVICRTH
jgi:hypothetical protein